MYIDCHQGFYEEDCSRRIKGVGGERLGVVRWRFQVWKIICLEKIKTKARMIYK